MPLQTTHRPTTFDELVGNDSALNALQIAIEREDNPHAYLFTGIAGSGKSQPLLSQIQTPTGPILMRDAQIGTTIFGNNGEHQKVIGVFPQGELETYEITFRDKCTCYCSADHLWAVWTIKTRQTKSAYKVMTTQEIMDTGVLTNSNNYRFSVPLCAPLQYRTKSFPIPPYTLGALIGDGTALGQTPALVLGDSSIIDRVRTELIDFQITSTEADIYPNCRRYRLTWPHAHNKNPISIFCRKVQLDVRSPLRFIPKDFLYGDVAQRWSLLRGLMDTDGSICKNRVSFSTMSEQLALDIQTLTQSLGGTAIISRYDRKQKGAEYHVSLKTFENPFYIKRKAEQWHFSSKNPPSRFIIKITPVGKMKQQCIAVSSTNNLYLTDNHIVTHNTTLAGVLREFYECSPIDYFYYNAANTRGIDTMRDISVNARLSPMGGKYKIYVLDECHQITGPAIESLLLVLENAPKHTLFILCTSEPEKLKLSIRRRCFQCNLSPLTEKEVQTTLLNVLSKEGVNDMPASVLRAICTAAQGSAGMALAMLDAVIDLADPVEQLEVIDGIQGVNDTEGIEIAKALISGNWKTLQGLLTNFNGEPESLRYLILSYFSKVLLGKNGKLAPLAFLIISAFSESFMYSKKAGLIASCYYVCTENNK